MKPCKLHERHRVIVDHRNLVMSFIKNFFPNFASGSLQIYTRGTREYVDVFDSEFLKRLVIDVGPFGLSQDVVLYDPVKQRLLFIQSETCPDVFGSKRRAGLAERFDCSSVELVFVTIFF